MAFNEPRILNQSTIKENKQGHLEDSEDHFKKSLSARSYQIHFNPFFLKPSRKYSPQQFYYVHLWVCTHKPARTQKYVFYTHRLNRQLFRDASFWNLIKLSWHCVPRAD